MERWSKRRQVSAFKVAVALLLIVAIAGCGGSSGGLSESDARDAAVAYNEEIYGPEGWGLGDLVYQDVTAEKTDRGWIVRFEFYEVGAPEEAAYPCYRVWRDDGGITHTELC